MSKSKLPLVRTSIFVPGGPSVHVGLHFTEAEVSYLSPLIQQTGEYHVHDAMKALLIGMATSPPSTLMLERQMHLTLLGEYVKKTHEVFKEKLSEAASEAEAEIMKHLAERGIIE